MDKGTLSLAFMIVAAVIFLLDGWLGFNPPANWSSGRLISIGLFFVALSFIVGPH